MEAGTTNIGNILNRSRTLKIPYFQRSYVWKEEQWERFVDDMKYVSVSNQPYFMGAIILKQQETASTAQRGDIRSIIDGQQRLTTINLFFRALFNKNETADKFNEIFKTYSGELILQHNYYDCEVFKKILLNSDLSINDKNNNLYKCYDYFLKNIEKDEINPNNLLGNLIFIGIDLNYQEDEQLIFDTINSLGVSLTTAELLKNYLFHEDVDLYINNWKSVFEKDESTKEYWDQKVTVGRNKRANIDLFLESYLLIKIQEKSIDVKTEDKDRYFKIDSVFNSYKDFMKKYNLDKTKVINEIKVYAEIYRANIVPQIVEQDINKDNYVQRINLVVFALDTFTIVPYLLYVCKNVSDLNERNKIFKYLETYLLRRLIIRATTKNYNQLFRQSFINKEIDSLDKLIEIIEKKSDKLNYMPSDEDLKKGLLESALTNKQATGVLYLIEKTVRSPLNSTELKWIKEYSLEHIMPKMWEENWLVSESFSDVDKEKRNKLLLTLGNLTIITKKLNSSISNANWSTKKQGNGNKKGLNEYANGIEIFSKYLTKEEWDEECIKERAEELTELVVKKVWSLNKN